MYIYVCLSVSVCVSVLVYVVPVTLCPHHVSPEWMLFCLLTSVLKLPKRGLAPDRPLRNRWLISPLENWAAPHLGEGNIMPQNDFL